MERKNILIITAYYPPIQSIATNRIFSFAKYLNEDRFNIYVIMPEPGEKISEKYYLKNVTIITIPNRSIIKRATFKRRSNMFWHYMKTAWNVALLFCFFDEFSGWIKAAIIKGKELIKKNEIDLVISSYPPLSAHEVALNIKKTHQNIKWIADMRDPISLNAYLPKVLRKKYQRKEKEILSYADAVTSISKPILDGFRNLSLGTSIFYEIRNGYDFEIPLYEINKKNSVFTIMYSGSFYGDRNPLNFFKALEELFIKQRIELRVEFLGVSKPYKIPNNLKKNIYFTDKLPYEECLEKLKKADILLLISPTNGEKGVYTGKLFEYLGLVKPILGLVPKDDVAAKLIEQAKAGYIAQNEDISEIKSKILEAYNDWKNDKIFTPNLEIIKKHHRKEQAQIMKKLIGELLDE